MAGDHKREVQTYSIAEVETALQRSPTAETPRGKNPKLSDEQARMVYAECTSRVRADLQQTEQFKEHWLLLCQHTNLFSRFTVTVREQTL